MASYLLMLLHEISTNVSSKITKQKHSFSKALTLQAVKQSWHSTLQQTRLKLSQNNRKIMPTNKGPI